MRLVSMLAILMGRGENHKFDLKKQTSKNFYFIERISQNLSGLSSDVCMYVYKDIKYMHLLYADYRWKPDKYSACNKDANL